MLFRIGEVRILFAMLHPGYVRPYESTLRLLAERGHDVQLVFSRQAGEKPNESGATELALAEKLSPLRLAAAPARSQTDPWRSAALAVRLAGDVGRYLDPRFASVPDLRVRALERLRSERCPHVVTSTARQLAERLASLSDQRVSNALVGLTRALERAIPIPRPVLGFLRVQSPDVVLVTPAVEFGSDQVEWIKAARELRIPCGICVASWDNLSSKGLLRGNPDRVFVWNEAQRREAEELHGIPPARVVATGAPRFDAWFVRGSARRPEEFRAAVELDPHRPHILYVCSSAFIAGDELPFVERWLASLRSSEDRLLREVGVLVRPHPQNSAHWSGVDLRPLGNVAVWPPRGAFPLDDGSRADFFDSVAHAVAVVGLNTSAQIEAAILGKSVLTVRGLGDAATVRDTLHYRYLLRENGGFVHEALAFDDHHEQLRSILQGGVDDRMRIARFVGSFIRPHGLDRPATPILVDAIERLAACRSG